MLSLQFLFVLNEVPFWTFRHGFRFAYLRRVFIKKSTCLTYVLGASCKLPFQWSAMYLVWLNLFLFWQVLFWSQYSGALNIRFCFNSIVNTFFIIVNILGWWLLGSDQLSWVWVSMPFRIGNRLNAVIGYLLKLDLFLRCLRSWFRLIDLIVVWTFFSG